MDIRIHSPEVEFTLRVAALILDQGRLLIVKHKDYDCTYTIGGKVKLNETASEAVIRETYEETGHLLSVDRLVFVQERFYGTEEGKHHEVTFFYLMKSNGCRMEANVCTDQRREKLLWVPVEELEAAKLVPKFLQSALLDLTQDITHIVSRET